MLRNQVINVKRTRSNAAACADSRHLTCLEAAVDPSKLGDSTLTFPGGIQLSFANTIPPNPYAYHYIGTEGEAELVFNPETGGMHGHFQWKDKSYVLEYLGTGAGHVWKEINVQNLEEQEGVDYVEDPAATRFNHYELVRQAAADNTTIARYSIKFYYTQDFATVTPDIDGFIDLVLAETNQGYINSGVPLIAYKFCQELATISDGVDGSTMLSNFANMKDTATALRGSADAAALLVNNLVNCGIAYLNTISSGYTLSVTAKSCATGYYSFGHELGHNFGLAHNLEVMTNSLYPHGHGHHIAQGSAATGYRTIMAYQTKGHSERVNYYSNPSITFSKTGTSTGVEGLSNNAAVLMVNRMSFAGIGDESGTCESTNLPQTSMNNTQNGNALK